LIHRGRILILDDCLSAVDVATERRIIEHLQQATQRQTTIVISTRLSAVAHADQIVVLEDGSISEHGDHASLLALGGLYARLWSEQKEADSA
jgi:ABC-type multidrug transport system fused ATPase/permease subunit